MPNIFRVHGAHKVYKGRGPNMGHVMHRFRAGALF